MSALALQVDFDFILDSFPWASYTDPTILDTGGGNGDVSIGLKSRLPSARIIVQDASETARKQGERISADLGTDITFEPYDFRTPQPVQGADIYYFRNIFHNWPDKNCIDILRNQICSLKRNARLVIDDFTLHEPGTLSAAEERKRRWMDINMLVFFGSHERTVEEWRKLLMTADSRFELVKINRAPDKPNTILEIAWTGPEGTSIKDYGLDTLNGKSFELPAHNLGLLEPRDWHGFGTGQKTPGNPLEHKDN